jgi:ABC-2 type transport system ATP-binding protein
VNELRRTFEQRRGLRKLPPHQAVAGISFTIRRGELFGLLGPNGAGKTTTAKILSTLLLPTSGTARVAGLDVVQQTVQVRRKIGFVFGGDKGLYDRISAVDNLKYFADLYGVPWREQRSRIPELIDRVGLRGSEHKSVEGYSRGMKQRLHIARALLHHPEVLFLDEPSNGLDPLGARQLRSLVSELAAEGTSIMLTTHQMEEADALCDRLAVVVAGEIRVEGTPTVLKGATSATRVVEGTAYGIDEATVRADLQTIDSVVAINFRDLEHHQTVLVTVRGNSAEAETVAARAAGSGVQGIRVRDATLEDAYLSIVYGVVA